MMTLLRPRREQPGPDDPAPAPDSALPVCPRPPLEESTDDDAARVTQVSWLTSARRRFRTYFVDESVNFWTLIVPSLLFSALLYTRSITSNFIFDEQEALLANPYVNGKGLGFFAAIHRDFWGLPAERSVGSYRPLPDMIWRLLASGLALLQGLGARFAHTTQNFVLTPWVFHWCNVVIHAANGALLACVVYHASQKRLLAWLSGAFFVTTAVLTEAVSGVVGIADVLGGLGALLALAALRLPMWSMAPCVLGAMLLGLFSKESALVGVPLVPLAALMFARNTHRAAPRPLARALVAGVSALLALILYVECRKRWFPSALPADLLAPLPAGTTVPHRWAHALLVWFHQPPLPRDPLNNPLVTADLPHRVAGALRVFFRGLVQLVFPKTLSGDYSFPQEPVPDRVVFPESVLGGMAMIGLPLLGLACWARAALAARRGADVTTQLLVAFGMIWIAVSYFPHSNIPVLLPTVRAERFLYFPALGSAVVLACFFAWLLQRADRSLALALLLAFSLFQCVRARMHALDYTDDLVFWRATRDAVPRSAKAHLNYSVMWGARGHLDTRLEESHIAVELAPSWPMAHVYLGDTLCRLHRPDEAWSHYVAGFEIAENESNLIALALQCLWDEKGLAPHQDELLALGDKHPGSWLDYLAKDIVNNGTEHNGVEPKYRPRGYNEGPKD